VGAGRRQGAAGEHWWGQGWRRAGEVEAGLTLVAARCEGAKRRCRGSRGSDERQGGPAARAEVREVAAAWHRKERGKSRRGGGIGFKIAPF
jgi:hypothetical protein